MSHSRCWRVEIVIDEHADERRTHAQARLLMQDQAARGDGTAWRDPRDAKVPAVGDQIAAARALADLARQLLDAARTDQASTVEVRRPGGEPAR